MLKLEASSGHILEFTHFMSQSVYNFFFPELTFFSMYSGSLIGHPVENFCIVLTDGASHAVDSSELAFKLAAIYAFRQVILSS